MNEPSRPQFGPSLARRVAARTGVRRHTGNARAIGVVSRSAVGFGQAIGRSRQTRPNVTPDSLTSPRLRPPAGWWRTLATPDVDVAEPWARPTWTDDLVPVTRHTRRPTPGAPAGARRGDTATVPAAPATTAPVTSGAPTTGLGRLDALRSLIASGRAPDGSSISPDVLLQQLPDEDLPIERVAAERVTRPVAAMVSPHEGAASTEPAARHALTEAGPATGPGALGRRVRPEPVAPGTAAQRAPGGIPTVATPNERAAAAPAPPPAPAGPPGDAAPDAAGNTAPVRRSPVRRERGVSARESGATPRRDDGAAWQDTHAGVRAPAATRNGDARDRRGPDGSTPAADARDRDAPTTAPRRRGPDGGTPAGATTEAAPTTAPRRRGPDGSTPAADARDRDAPTTAGPRADGTPITARGEAAPIAPPGDDRRRAPRDLGAAPTSDRGTLGQARRDRGFPASAHGQDSPATAAPGHAPAERAPDGAGGPVAADGRAMSVRRDPVIAPPATRAPREPGQASDDGDAPAAAIHDRGTAEPAWPAAGRARPARADARRGADTPSVAPPAPVESGAADLRLGLDAPADAPSHAADLRVQRLITSDPARRQTRSAARARPAADARLGNRAGGSEMGDTLVAPPLARPQPARRPRPTPALPGAGDGAQPVRRVTLPRAMSRTHRPDPLIGGSARDRADVASGADTRLGVRPPSAPRGAPNGAAPLDAGLDDRATVARRVAATNPRGGDARFDDRSTADGPADGSPPRHRPVPEPRTSLEGFDRPATGTAPARGVAPRDHRDATDPGSSGVAHPDRRSRPAPGVAGHAAIDAVASERPDVGRWGQLQRGASGRGPAHDVERRVSVRPPTDAGERVAHRTPTPPRRRSSIVDNGIDVLRRVLAAPTPPPPGSAPSADGLPVAPAGRLGPESRTAGDNPVAQPHTTHAAGRVRSDSGAALAERFMTELSHAVSAQPTPLPTTFRPMADEIAGRRTVMLSTDTASRRALRSVGKRAATVGDTIHVDAAASQLVAPSKRITEVIAHELTHVAHPSPAPRFFDDIDESPEERRADAVARMIARAPLAPAASTLVGPHTAARRAATGRGGADVVRRSPTAAPAPGTIRADDLAASVARTPAPDVVRRQHTVAAPARPHPSTAPAAAPPAPPAPAQAPRAVVASGADSESAAIADRDEEFRALLERNLDVVLRRVEDHILIDIERRGGRAWRGF